MTPIKNMQSCAVALFYVFGDARSRVRCSLLLQWPAQELVNELSARGLSLAVRSNAETDPVGRLLLARQSRPGLRGDDPSPFPEGVSPFGSGRAQSLAHGGAQGLRDLRSSTSARRVSLCDRENSSKWHTSVPATEYGASDQASWWARRPRGSTCANRGGWLAALVGAC